MLRTKRRRLVILLGSLSVGTSGFVASAAFSFGSQGSLGDNWVQVEGTDQAVDLNPTQTQVGEESNGGEGNADGDGNTNDNSDEEDQSEAEEDQEEGGNETEVEEETNTTVEEPVDDAEADPEEDTTDDTDNESSSGQVTRVQVISEPNNDGNAVNTNGPAQWNGSVFQTDLVLDTTDGFFRGLSVEGLNRNAVSKIGALNSSGYPDGRAAFIIANVGPEGNGPGGTVFISGKLYFNGEPLSTDQLRFPYRVVAPEGSVLSKGLDLFAETGVTLPNGHIIEVAIVFDTRSGVNEVEQIDNLRFSAIGVN